jgi:hypothetical protein
MRVGHKPLWQFQKWAVMRYYEIVPFGDFDNNAKKPVPEQSTLDF